jgi:hypothetical protein
VPMAATAELRSKGLLGLFEFFRERERGEVSVFQRLTKAFICADSKKLKLRASTMRTRHTTPRPGSYHALSQRRCTVLNSVARVK